MIPKINSAHGSDTRNILNRAIDLINAQGKTMQDLVAEGQLTEEQYAELISIVNGNLKSGEVSIFDLDSSLRTEIEKINKKTDEEYTREVEQRLNKVIAGLDGTEEFYTPIGLENYMTTHGEEWVI